jgi:transposase-like protein
MPMLSHLHQLFNAEQCQAYIRTLRWKDRPLQCPRCQSHTIGHWGTYQYRPGCKRYWCHNCKRTFNDLTDTLLHRSQRPLSYWILATFLLCLACSSRRIAKELGIHIRTSYRWCWWLRNAAMSYEMHRQLEGTVGSVSKVEMDCDCCHTGPCPCSLHQEGMAHDVHRSPLPALSE